MLRVESLLAMAWASIALGQTGVYTWELSLDGATWSSDVLASAGSTIHVRLLAGWAGITGTDLGYAGGQFDARIINGGADTVSNIQRPTPFGFSAQTLVASTIGADMKIDTAADTSGFGSGTGWVNPGQAANDFGTFGYNRDNPAVIFRYDLTLGASGAQRIFDMVLNPDSRGRAMAVYTSSAGTQVRMGEPSVTVHAAGIPLPTPSTASLLYLFGLTPRRRKTA